MALISKLPRKEKALAVKRRREYVQGLGITNKDTHNEYIQEDGLDIAFVWSETPEGFQYWVDIDKKYSE